MDHQAAIDTLKTELNKVTTDAATKRASAISLNNDAADLEALATQYKASITHLGGDL